jgi:hypothetical protein
VGLGYHCVCQHHENRATGKGLHNGNPAGRHAAQQAVTPGGRQCADNGDGDPQGQYSRAAPSSSEP